jgi:hypothetical protein
MMFANPVDPAQAIRIHYQSPAGPASAFPRTDEGGMDGTLKLLAAAALLAVGYVVGGFAVASVAPVAPTPVDVDGGIGGPVSKLGGQPVSHDPVPGEFRLGPGNIAAPGVVVRLGVPQPFPGDFRLGPGNLPPAGIGGR